MNIFTVAFFLHAAFGDEAQGSAVDAVAQAAERFRAVVEHMAQVGIAGRASHFGTYHAVRRVGQFRHECIIDRFRERRPSAARVELVGGEEQRLAGGDVHVDSLFMVVPVFVGKRAFRSVSLCHVVLQFRQLRA